MSDTVKEIRSFLPEVSYTLIQSTLLFCNYGLNYSMPWWVVWFPSLFYGVILGIVLFVLLIIGILSLIT